MTSAEAQLASYFAAHEPAMAELARGVRAKLRARLPGLFEVVYAYQGQNALVISYSPTEKGYEALCSIRLDPDGVKLYFTKSPLLSQADPDKLLQGSAKKVRYVVLSSVEDVDRPEIEALMAAALEHAELRLDPGAEGAIIIKAEGRKQRATKTG